MPAQRGLVAQSCARASAGVIEAGSASSGSVCVELLAAAVVMAACSSVLWGPCCEFLKPEGLPARHYPYRPSRSDGLDVLLGLLRAHRPVKIDHDNGQRQVSVKFDAS